MHTLKTTAAIVAAVVLSCTACSGQSEWEASPDLDIIRGETAYGDVESSLEAGWEGTLRAVDGCIALDEGAAGIMPIVFFADSFAAYSSEDGAQAVVIDDDTVIPLDSRVSGSGGFFPLADGDVQDVPERCSTLVDSDREILFVSSIEQ